MNGFKKLSITLYVDKKEGADSLRDLNPRMNVLIGQSNRPQLEGATQNFDIPWESTTEGSKFICFTKRDVSIDSGGCVVEVQAVPGFTFKLSNEEINPLVAGAPSGWLRFAVNPHSEIQLTSASKNFETGYAFKDSVGRIGFFGNIAASKLAPSCSGVSRTTLNINYGATYFTNSGFIGDTRGDQSSTDAFIGSYEVDNFDRKSGLSRFGFRTRLDKKFKGWEAVGYFAPIIVVAPDNRSLFAMEVEAGARNLTEFKNATTIAGVQENAFARVSGMVEFMPQLGQINSNIGTGTQFYLRGRGWLDSVMLASDKTGARFRGFLDAELSQTFGGKYRAFLRFEAGSLPPDLSKATKRVFIGVGSKF